MKKRLMAFVIAGLFFAPAAFGQEARTGEIGRVSGHSPSSLRCDWASRSKDLPSDQRTSTDSRTTSTGTAGTAR